MTTTKSAKLPARLFSAFNWVDIAGELPLLASLKGDELNAYCEAAAENAADHGEEISSAEIYAVGLYL